MSIARWPLVVVGCLVWATTAGGAEDSPAPPTLAELAAGELPIEDLSYALNEKSVYWPGENYEPFRLKTIATLERDGVLSKAFSMPEHLGTHLDAPNHFGAGKPAVEKIPPADLFAEGVVIDVSGQASADADYRLTVDDLQRWERDHGPIPQRAIVFLHTGWGRYWSQPVRYKNADVRGQMHFPGYSAEAARWLIEERDARGIGIDTMSIDYGLSKDFAVHHVVNGASRYGLENVARLERLPARDFFVFVAPIKIEGGTGGPARIFAVLRGSRRAP